MNGQDFHLHRSRFSLQEIEWQVKIFMMRGRDFHNDRLRFFFSFLMLLKQTRIAVSLRIHLLVFDVNQES